MLCLFSFLLNRLTLIVSSKVSNNILCVCLSVGYTCTLTTGLGSGLDESPSIEVRERLGSLTYEQQVGISARQVTASSLVERDMA